MDTVSYIVRNVRCFIDSPYVVSMNIVALNVYSYGIKSLFIVQYRLHFMKGCDGILRSEQPSSSELTGFEEVEF